MIDRVTNPELRTALSNHFQETRGHVTKVQALLRRDATEDSSKSCKIIGSLTSEASDTAEDVTNPAVRDIALIGAAQQIEHYEIAIYGTLRRWAEILGLSDDVTVLKSIEAEEGKADKTLSDIAGTVNSMAAAA
jgi:ferritin-like metal-binding protein YciE